jgi:hypothetical protein
MADGSDKGRSRLILVELNELNFDVISRYLASENLPGFSRLMSWGQVKTTSEQSYESLEPWIQWPSVHCGMTAEEHSVFRLGDIVNSDAPQIFELLEQRKLRVGAISAMNAANRLREPAYFIPDPWTRTPSDSSWWSKSLASAVSQAVNDNAHKSISLRSAMLLGLALLRFARPKHYGTYLRLLSGCIGKPWRKALILDLLLHDIHVRMFRSRRADFSTLFLNAGAHIQHHYFFNAGALRDQVPIRNPAWYVPDSVDPVLDMVRVYDRILTDYQELPGVEVIVATGLSQLPYDRVKYYYRLKDHAAFLRGAGVPFRDVLPRMTRDFLIECADAAEAAAAQHRLAAITVEGDPMFAEIDNRGASLFVSLTYPREITAETRYVVDGKSRPLAEHVSFVAIKNGMHQSKGFAFFTPNVRRFAPPDGRHVKELHGTIMRFFGIGQATD